MMKVKPAFSGRRSTKIDLCIIKNHFISAKMAKQLKVIKFFQKIGVIQSPSNKSNVSFDYLSVKHLELVLL